MPDFLTYTVAPGPGIIQRMGLSWTLFSPTGAHLATFSHGPDGEPPGPVDLALSKELAEELAAAGYAVQALSGMWPEPVNDVQVFPGLEGAEPVAPVDLTATGGLAVEAVEVGGHGEPVKRRKA